MPISDNQEVRSWTDMLRMFCKLIPEAEVVDEDYITMLTLITKQLGQLYARFQESDGSEKQGIQSVGQHLDFAIDMLEVVCKRENGAFPSYQEGMVCELKELGLRALREATGCAELLGYFK
jgi:hypothetical protein